MKRITQLIIALILSKSMFAQPKVYNWDTITFEDNKEFLFIDSSESNIWQVCIPNKVFFDSAFSPNKAIVTDSMDYYPKNNYSFFDVYIGTFNNPWYPYNIFVEITHKFDTDIHKDGGYITVSYDQGNTWMNIIHDSSYFGGRPYWEDQNLYTENDTLFNGEFGFSGRSAGWIQTVFSWYILPIKNTDNEVGDTIILRFNFISDSVQSDKEGWMIDDIRIYSKEIGGGGLEDHGIFKSLKMYPDPASSFLNVKLDRLYNLIDIEIVDMNGNEIKKSHFYNTANITLSCSDLSNGVYVIRTVLNSKEIFVNKVIIEK